MSKINSKLEVLLEDVKMSHEHHNSIISICNKYNDLKKQSDEAKIELSRCIDALCADLAKEIRRIQPSLNVTMNSIGCNVSYRAKSINCEVVPFNNKWSFSSSDFGRMFMRRYPDCCELGCPLNHLAKCISEFFLNQYRSLNK